MAHKLTSHFAITALLALLLAVLLGSTVLRAQAEPQDKTFTIVHDVWSTGSKAQGRTGTCWCFSTTSFIESEAKRMGLGEFELSEIYTVRHAYIEKGIRYLRLWGKNNFGQGGLSHDLLYLIPKYGLMRDIDFSGLLPGQTGHNHREMERELKSYLDEILAARKGIPADWLKGYQAIMDKHVGKIPAKVTIDGKEMTPQEFASDVIKFDPKNYVEFTSYSYMPFYKKGELLVPDNWLRYEKYYNVPLEDFISIIDHAINNGYSVVLDLDVSEKSYHRDKGYAVVEHDLKGTTVSQEDREAMFDSMSTTDDHLMHTVGIANDKDGSKYYYTKDSGGPDRGPFKGFAYLSENYVRAKVLAFMIHKDGIPPELRKKLEID